MKASENNIPSVLKVKKELGETPLEVIERVKRENEALRDVPITYAGRLDPMAEGLLLLLVGEEVHKKEEYMKLDKEYEFRILFGFSTDTHDLLGRVTDSEKVVFSKERFEETLQSFVGTQDQQYPAYSSKPVLGKPLFTWARESKLHEIDIPFHEISISKLALVDVSTISIDELKDEIRERISYVRGDFRQKETLELWNAYIDNIQETKFSLATCRIECSSGTYVRKLVDDMGRALGVPATTFSIVRTKVGTYSL